MNQPSPSLLFSIDLEDYYPADSTADARSAPLHDLVAIYLDLLARHHVRATFFVVGELARREPRLLARIAQAGHELGCHGDRHLTLDRLSPETFASDLRSNRRAVEEAAGQRVQGFRAPLLSLTHKTAWAHTVLAGEGFVYSSSVLPAPNPLFGWEEFGTNPRQVNGVWEIPISLAHVPLLGMLPLFSGTYFRILPWSLARRSIESAQSTRPLVSYFHPYDIDHRQPWTMHAGVRGNRLMNYLLFARRSSLPARLENLMKACPVSTTCGDYVARCLASQSARPSL
jgi:polysaccharide deacetylase family protein (PEP-CTERM system associated)